MAKPFSLRLLLQIRPVTTVDRETVDKTVSVCFSHILTVVADPGEDMGGLN